MGQISVVAKEGERERDSGATAQRREKEERESMVTNPSFINITPISKTMLPNEVEFSIIPGCQQYWYPNPIGHI